MLFCSPFQLPNIILIIDTNSVHASLPSKNDSTMTPLNIILETRHKETVIDSSLGSKFCSLLVISYQSLVCPVLGLHLDHTRASCEGCAWKANLDYNANPNRPQSQWPTFQNVFELTCCVSSLCSSTENQGTKTGNEHLYLVPLRTLFLHICLGQGTALHLSYIFEIN